MGSPDGVKIGKRMLETELGEHDKTTPAEELACGVRSNLLVLKDKVFILSIIDAFEDADRILPREAQPHMKSRPWRSIPLFPLHYHHQWGVLPP
jgi:hypothetical protein